MSAFRINLTLDDYLAQWFIHDHGGELPVKLRKGSIESRILEVYLTKRPAGVIPTPALDSNVSIELPHFRHKPPETYNHLPQRARNALVTVIRNRFDLELWNDLHHFGRIGSDLGELVYAFMEKNGIQENERNWNAILKRYQRMRDRYLHRERSRKKKK